MDAIAGLENDAARDRLRTTGANEDADPGTLAERQVRDSATARKGVVADDELEHLGEVVVDPPERNPEPSRDDRDRRSRTDQLLRLRKWPPEGRALLEQLLRALLPAPLAHGRERTRR